MLLCPGQYGFGLYNSVDLHHVVIAPFLSVLVAQFTTGSGRRRVGPQQRCGHLAVGREECTGSRWVGDSEQVCWVVRDMVPWLAGGCR